MVGEDLFTRIQKAQTQVKYSGCRYLKALVCPAENISCSLAATGAENADEHSINCMIFFFRNYQFLLWSHS
jgi:hypothetical protein